VIHHHRNTKVIFAVLDMVQMQTPEELPYTNSIPGSTPNNTPSDTMSTTSTATGYLDKPWLLASQTPYKLVNAIIIDPVEGQLMKGASVTIEGGLITEISFEEGSQLPQQSSTGHEPTVIDLQGTYLCPGLIDAHVHVTATPGEIGLKGTYKNISASMNHYRTTFLVKEMLLRGFTTARDCGGADAALKEAIAEWLIPGPRLLISGHALSQTGGHGDQRDAHADDDPTTKCCGGHKPGIGRICDGVTECMAAVRDEMRKGADFIKIMAGGGVSSKLNNLGHSQFLPEEISAITRTAKSFDTYVTAHAYSNRAMRHAVENGAVGIEHGNFLDQETAKFLAEKKVYFTPTLATYSTLMIPPFDQYISGTSKTKNAMVMRSGLESLKIAEEAGVAICFGSDLMAGMQRFQSNEFTIRANVLSSLSILQSATVNPARMMGLENEIGRIACGLSADIVVLKKNPLEDVTILDDRDNILAVIKEGRVAKSCLENFPVDTIKGPW
jgi:imidazolonepropionase-like amidohydrolase